LVFHLPLPALFPALFHQPFQIPPKRSICWRLWHRSFQYLAICTSATVSPAPCLPPPLCLVQKLPFGFLFFALLFFPPTFSLFPNVCFVSGVCVFLFLDKDPLVSIFTPTAVFFLWFPPARSLEASHCLRTWPLFSPYFRSLLPITIGWFLLF